jgi:hypothetical protein
MDERIKREFAQCPLRDDEGRLKLQIMQQVTNQMRVFYEEHVNTGKIARKKLSEPTIKERWERFR